MAATHPYVPADIVLDGYVPNKDDLTTILGSFFSVSGAVAAATIAIVGRSKHLNTGDKLVVVWMVLCAGIHFFLEGYYSVYNREFLGRQDILAQIWKEYSKSDSRYATSDPFIVAMETVTAFVEGPMAFFAVLAYLSARQRLGDLLVLLVSTGELYGCVLYFALEWLSGFSHARPEPLYFYFYFVFMNILWIVFPSILIVRCGSRLLASTNDKEKKP